MDKLRSYINALPTAEQFHFARRCGTTIAYLRNVLNANNRRRFGLALASAIERETGGQVTVEDLRSDIDISHLRARAARRKNAA